MVLAAVVAALVLAALWLIVIAVVLGMIAAEPPPGRVVDPYAADVAQFNSELADWDRRGRP